MTATIAGRLKDLQARAANLGPLAARVQARHVAGHRAMIAAGVDPQGSPVAPLAPSTLRRRGGNGPPRAPRGMASRVVARCAIQATIDPGSGALRVKKSWPGFTAARYLHEGTSRMPARPMGFRPEDHAADKADLRAHVLGDQST